MPKKAKLRWDDASGAAANAHAQLPALASAYFNAGRKLMNGSPTPVKLHGFRLKTKRLRYTLELFRPCYGPGLEQRLASLRQIQTLLGEVNDCVAARRVAAGTLSPRSAQFLDFKRFLDARATRLTGRFHRHWRQQFDAPGREEWWTRYLRVAYRLSAR